MNTPHRPPMTWPLVTVISVHSEPDDVRSRYYQVTMVTNPSRPRWQHDNAWTFNDRALWPWLGEQLQPMPRATNVIAAVRPRAITNHKQSVPASTVIQDEAKLINTSTISFSILHNYSVARPARSRLARSLDFLLYISLF